MNGRPIIGSNRMVTIGVRVEPAERERLEELAQECGISLCAYIRDMIRLELARAARHDNASPVATTMAQAI